MREDSIAEFEGPRGDSVDTNDAVMNQRRGLADPIPSAPLHACEQEPTADRGGVGVTVFLDVLYALLLSALAVEWRMTRKGCRTASDVCSLSA